MRKTLIILTTILISSCSSISVLNNEAQNIEIVNEVPNKSNCKYLGEIVGSQGNFFTGDFTSNENLVIGARNELRNKAYKLGGNLIHMQDMKNTNAYGSLGTTNTTAVGKTYYCRHLN
jgi:hypothetical protein